MLATDMLLPLTGLTSLTYVIAGAGAVCVLGGKKLLKIGKRKQ